MENYDRTYYAGLRTVQHARSDPRVNPQRTIGVKVSHVLGRHNYEITSEGTEDAYTNHQKLR